MVAEPGVIYEAKLDWLRCQQTGQLAITVTFRGEGNVKKYTIAFDGQGEGLGGTIIKGNVQKVFDSTQEAGDGNPIKR